MIEGFKFLAVRGYIYVPSQKFKYGRFAFWGVGYVPVGI